MVRFLAATGARVSELVQIKVEHVQVGYYDIYTKGGKIRRIYIPKTLRTETEKWLQTLNRTSGYLFLNRFGERITTRGISHLSQSLWRAHHDKRHITTVEELCRKVWLERESGVPSLVPPSLCQEFLGEVQRHSPACRSHGTRKHRDYTYLSAKK